MKKTSVFNISPSFVVPEVRKAVVSVHAAIAHRKEIARDTYEVAFKLKGAELAYAAGQYIWVTLPRLLHPDQKGARRAFSVCSSPLQKDAISIIFRAGESGFKKTLCALPIGARVDLAGPFGSLSLPKDAKRPAVCIAGGVAIAPFMSIVRHAYETKSTRRIVVLSAHTRADRAVYRDELERIVKSDAHIRFHCVIGAMDLDSIAKYTSDVNDPVWYVLGTGSMVHDVSRMLCAYGVKEHNMRFEEFYPEPDTQAIIDATNGPSKKGVFRIAAENSTNHIVITDTNGRIKYANAAARHITGYSFEEMRDQTPRLWGGMMESGYYKHFWHTIKDKREPFVGEFTNRRKNGEVYSAFSRTSPLIDEEGMLIGFIGTEEDLSELKEAHLRLEARTEEIGRIAEAVEKEKARDEAVLAAIGDAVVACDIKGRVILFNAAAEELSGFTAREVIGMPYDRSLTFVTENSEHTTDNALREAMRSGGKMVTVNSLIVRKDGNKIPVVTSAAPIRDKKGHEAGYIIVSRDVRAERAIDRAKTEFVSLASHQLRTPLTAINWYVEMLLHGDAGALTGEQKSFLDSVYQSSKRMVQLVNDLLSVSRIETGKMHIELKQTNLEAFVQDVAQEVDAWARARQCAVRVHAPRRAMPPLLIDQTLLRQVLYNLLTNAVRYSYKTKCEVDVRFAREKDRYVVSVSDQGIGIPRDVQPHIFERFFRADNAKKADTEGTGLGLYVAKMIMESSGGALWFESKEGEGTTFYVAIPKGGMLTKDEVKMSAP